MDLEIIIPSEVSQKKKDKHHILMVFTPFHRYHYMWNLKYDTNEPTYEAETLANTAIGLVVSQGKGRGGGLGACGQWMRTITPRMDGQEGPMDSTGTVFNVWGKQNGKE